MNITTSSITKEKILEEATSSGGRVDLRSIKRVLVKYNILELVQQIRPNLTEAFYWWVNNLTQHPKPCLKCGNDVKFYGFKTLYSENNYCSVKCAYTNNNIQAKKTLIERYGTDHQMRVGHFKEKVRKTWKDRYGTNGMIGSEAFSDAMIEKYGVDNCSKIDSVIEKRSITFMERYGGQNVDSISPINEQSRQTLSLELDINWPNQYSFQQLSAWVYSKRTLIKRSTQYNFNKIEIDILSQKITATHSCGVRGSWNIGYGCFRCLTCFPKNESSFERDVRDYLDNLKIAYVKNDRKKIVPLELDFLIGNVAIECNGDYWHSYSSRESVTEKNKHLQKLKACERVGIRLIQIPEYMWYSRKEQARGIIKSALGLNDKLYARKMSFKEITLKESSVFLEVNHIAGSTKAKRAFGLYDGDRLVQVATIAPHRFKKGDDWELVRLASLIGFTIVGGTSKLISGIKSVITNRIVSYVDRMLFSGSSFDKDKLLYVSSPGYKWIYKGKILSRYQCQKAKLHKVLGTSFNANLTEVDNMFGSGARRLWDCGNVVFII